MAKNQFAAPHFHDEEAARVWFETARWPRWPDLPEVWKRKALRYQQGLGRYRCAAADCRKDFTVMTGSVMERSHAKLTQWAVAFHLGASSKKGFSAHQLHRELGCQYNTLGFSTKVSVMEAMRRGGLDLPPMGGEGEVGRSDKTCFGNIPEAQRPKFKTYGKAVLYQDLRGVGRKRAIVALVERGGVSRSFHIPRRAPISSSRLFARTLLARHGCIPMKANYIIASAKTSQPTKPSITLPRNMRARRRYDEHS